MKTFENEQEERTNAQELAQESNDKTGAQNQLSLLNISESSKSWECIIDNVILFKDKNNISAKDFKQFWNLLGFKLNQLASFKKIDERISEIDNFFTYYRNELGIHVSYEEKLKHFLYKHIPEVFVKTIEINLISYCINFKVDKSIFCLFFSFNKKNYILAILEKFDDVYVKNMEKTTEIIIDNLTYKINYNFKKKNLNIEDCIKNECIVHNIYLEITNNNFKFSDKNFNLYEKILKKAERSF